MPDRRHSLDDEEIISDTEKQDDVADKFSRKLAGSDPCISNHVSFTARLNKLNK